MQPKSKLTIAIAQAVLAAWGQRGRLRARLVLAESPSGIEFSDFKGYEDWAVVSSTLKPGVPGNGEPFPDGSKIVKLH